MRLLLLALTISLAACAKKSQDDGAAPAQPTYTGYQAPSNCAETSAGSIDFLEWDPMAAKQYSCPVVSGQTCEMLVSDDGEHAQLVCSGVSTRPSSCVSDGTHPGGLHRFIDGTEGVVSVSDCGVWNHLRCMRFEGSSETEMRCLDNDLPYDSAFAFSN